MKWNFQSPSSADNEIPAWFSIEKSEQLQVKHIRKYLPSIYLPSWAILKAGSKQHIPVKCCVIMFCFLNSFIAESFFFKCTSLTLHVGFFRAQNEMVLTSKLSENPFSGLLICFCSLTKAPICRQKPLAISLWMMLTSTIRYFSCTLLNKNVLMVLTHFWVCTQSECGEHIWK